MSNDGEGPIHTYPLNDLIEHVLSEACPCRPSVQEDGMLVIHHAADGREYLESDGPVVDEVAH